MSRPAPKQLFWFDNPLAQLLTLAWPIAVSMVSFTVMTLIDTLFVGRLGPAALGGVGLGGTAAFVVICFGIGLLRAVKIQISQAVGAGNRDVVPEIVGSGLFIAATLGLICSAIGLMLAPLLTALAAGESAGAEAVAYCSIRVLGALPVLIGVALREARYGLGDSRSPMLAAVIANVLHVPLNAMLIFGQGMGVRGAAWATLVAQLIEVGLLVYAQRPAGFGLRVISQRRIRALCGLGIAVGLEFFLGVGAFATLVAVIARMGEADLAAHQIALQLCHFSFLPALAVGEAASVLTGQAVGADADRLVRRVAKTALALAAIYCGSCAIVFGVCAQGLAALFTSDARVAELTVGLLYVAAAFQLFDAANVVARGALRGTGDVRFSTTVAVGVAWLLGLPTAAWLGLHLGLGVVGAWVGLAFDIACGAGLLWWRLEREHWKAAARRARLGLERAGTALQPAVS